MTNPRVLFLDEPTSGLDSFTANEVRASSTPSQLILLARYCSGRCACIDLVLLVRGGVNLLSGPPKSMHRKHTLHCHQSPRCGWVVFELADTDLAQTINYFRSQVNTLLMRGGPHR